MTAVEFLKDFMWMKDHHYFLEGDLALAFSKAKEMEKEQRGYSEDEVLQLLLKLQQTESYDNLYDWFQQNKKH